MHADNNKIKKIASMFSEIAGRYDFINTVLSLGSDRVWRKKVVKIATTKHCETILDVATGTGKVALEALKQNSESRVFGIDPSLEMLRLAKSNGEFPVYLSGNAEDLPFKESAFDCVTVAFGIRNFIDLENGLQEILRVLKSGGIIAVLEFSLPGNVIARSLYEFYLGHIIPIFGKILSGTRAYYYLRDTIRTFPRDHEMMGIFEECGFENVRFIKFSLGVVACYIGEKPDIT